jgi:hypothetical protein
VCRLASAIGQNLSEASRRVCITLLGVESRKHDGFVLGDASHVLPVLYRIVLPVLLQHTVLLVLYRIVLPAMCCCMLLVLYRIV